MTVCLVVAADNA